MTKQLQSPVSKSKTSSGQPQRSSEESRFFMTAPKKGSRRLEPEYQIRLTSSTLQKWMRAFAVKIREEETRLTDIDSLIGDGDHGVNMRRGMNAVSAKLEELVGLDLAAQLRGISATLTSSVGGASGPLYGAFFLHASHGALHKSELNLADLALAMDAGYRGVVQLGKAEVGDKTMVDALAAAVRSLRESCTHRESLPQALALCRAATLQAVIDTIPMTAKKGRASYLGERSIGTQDPGATSTSLLFDSLAEAIVPISKPPSKSQN